MEQRASELNADLSARMRRIEGQVRGVQRMIEEGRDCPDILQQMTAIRSAVHQASLVLARAYMAKTLHEPAAPDDPEAALDKVMTTLSKLD
jgi:DNA-binding FrmR family transcriptional regulator